MRLFLSLLALLATLASVGGSPAHAKALDEETTAVVVRAQIDRALARLSVQSSRLTERERSLLEHAIATEVARAADELDSAVADTVAVLEQRTAWWDPIAAFWDERRIDRLVRTSIEQSDLEVTIARIAQRFEERVIGHASLLYEERRSNFDAVLRDLLDRQDVSLAVRDALLADLAGQIADDAGSHERAFEDLKVGPAGVAGEYTLSVGLAVAAARHAIARHLASRSTPALSARFVSGRAAGALSGPIGWTAVMGATAWDVRDLRHDTIATAGEALEDAVALHVASELRSEPYREKIADEIVTAIEHRLRTDHAAARRNIEATFGGVLAQLASPGVEAIANDMSAEEVVVVLKQVGAVFDDRHTDVDIRLKQRLIERLGIVQAQELVDRFGKPFLLLFEQQPEVVGRLSAARPWRSALAAALQAPDPRAALAFFDESRRLHPDLAQSEVRALALVRSTTGASPESITIDRLGLVAEYSILLRAVARDRPLVAQDTISAILEGRIGASELSEIAAWPSQTDRVRLLELLNTLPANDYAHLAQTIGLRGILRFRADIGAPLDLALLREDPRYAIVHAAARDGVAAVEVRRHLLARSAPGNIAGLDRLLLWSLDTLQIPPERISAPVLKDLHLLGFPHDTVPDAIEVPVAEFVMRFGLRWPLFLTAAFIVAPLIMFWIRATLFAASRPRVSTQSA